ncbi:MAG: site-2 protease family protein [Armatimonadota bacterium]
MKPFRLGKILGFDINVDLSWLLIFGLVVFTLSHGYFPQLYPGFDIATNWSVAILAALLLFASVLLHELGHSVVSRYFETPVNGITLFLFGGVAQVSDEAKCPKEEFWVGIAGPFVSFVLAALFYILSAVGMIFFFPKPITAIFSYLGVINVALAVFNLIPGFPLDGGRILRSAIWSFTGNLAKATKYASSVGNAFGYFLMFLGLIQIFNGILLSGLWMMFIGWFITGAARTSYQQVLIKEALSGIRVEQIMSYDVPVIQANMNLQQFVNEYLLRYEYSCYPVADGNTIIGVIGIDEIRKIPSEEWIKYYVGNALHRLDGSMSVGKTDDAWDAMKMLSASNTCRVIVKEDTNFIGTIGKENLYRLIQAKVGSELK